MTREQLIEQITAQVLSALKEQGVSEDFVPGKPVGDVPVEAPVPQHSTGTAAFTETSVRELASDALKDLAESEYKETIQFDDPQNPLALKAMERSTTARIGIGRDGERLTTKAMLSLRADHAMAKDAVLKPVDEGLLQRCSSTVRRTRRSRCTSRTAFPTPPSNTTSKTCCPSSWMA